MNKLGVVSVIALASFSLLGGCGKKGDDKAAGKGGDKGAAAGKGTGLAIDAAAVNSLVPEPLKAKLVFEKRDVVLEQGDKITYTLSAPKDWKQTSKMFGKLEPESGSGVGFFTKLGIGSNCDGKCEPKAWDAISDKTNFAPLAADGGKVLKDTKGKNTRLMVAEDKDGKVTITNVWWTDGASEYHYCTANLDSEIKDAAPAFEKACQAITVTVTDN